MVDYTVKEGESERKRRGGGCLTVFLVVVILLAAGAVSLYFLLPSILSSAISGGPMASMLPESVRSQTEQLGTAVRDNLGVLEQAGISPDQARMILEDLDFDKTRSIMSEIESGDISDTNQLIDLVGRYVDLSSLDTENLKSKFYGEIPVENLKESVARLKDSPVMTASGFRLIRETVLKVLEEQSSDSVPDALIREDTTTKKKK